MSAPESNQPPDLPEADEPNAPNELREALRRALPDIPTIPPEIDQTIIEENRRLLESRFGPAGKARRRPAAGDIDVAVNAGMQGPGKSTRGERPPFSRLMWKALAIAAAALVLGVAWWFRQWANTPINQQAVGNEKVEIHPRDVAFGTSVSPAGSFSNAMALAQKSTAAGRMEDAYGYLQQAIRYRTNDVDALYQHGSMAATQWKLNNATNDLARAHALAPTNPLVQYAYAAALIDGGDYAAARTNLDQLLATNPTRPDYLRARGTVEQLAGRGEEAISWRKRALLANPTNSEAFGDLESTLATFGRQGDIGPMVDEVAKAKPENAGKLRLALAYYFERRGDLAGAEAIARKEFTASASNADAAVLLAQCYLDQHEVLRAEPVLQSALAASPANQALRLLNAHVVFHTDGLDAALPDFESAFLSNPDFNPIQKANELFHMSSLNYGPEIFARLTNLLYTASQQHPDRASDMEWYQALLLRLRGDDAGAIAVFSDIINRNPSADALVQQAEIYNENGHYDDAIKSLNQALQLEPTNARAWNDKGYALEGRETSNDWTRFTEPAACYLQALLLNPYYDTAFNNLGRIRDRQRRPKQRADDCTSLMALRPSATLQYLLFRAVAHDYIGRPDLERKDAEAALALAPGNIQAHARLATGLQGMGRYDQARTETKYVLERNPQNQLAHNVNGLIAVDLGDWNAAEVCANTLNGLGAQGWGDFLTGRVEMYRGQYAQAETTFARGIPRNSLPYGWVFTAALMAGDGKFAATEATNMIERFGAFNERANWWFIPAYLGNRLAGDQAAADAVLKQIRETADHCNWPYPILRVFTGEIPYDVAISKSEEVVFEVLNKTEYWPHRAFGHEVATRIYLGMFAELEGDYEVARTQYQWVIDHPDQLSLDYLPLAKRRLQGIQGLKSRKKIPSSNDSRPDQGAHLDDGLIAWFPFDADLTDHGPRKLTANIQGQLRIENGSARFPGDGNFIELPGVSLRRRDFAVSLWMRADGTNATYNLFSQWDADKCGQAAFFEVRQTNQLYLGFFGDAVVAPVAIENPREWNHVVFQFENFRQKIWLNGRLLVEHLAQPVESDRNACRIGGYPPRWKGHHDFTGWLRDVRIYGRALSQSEIHQLAGVDRLLADNSTAAASSTVTLPPAVVQRPRVLSKQETAQLLDPRPLLQIEGNHLRISGPPVQVYELQYTLDLNVAWAPLMTLTNTVGAVDLIDEDTLREGARFYRVKLLSFAPLNPAGVQK